jgi:hypothetical protein
MFSEGALRLVSVRPFASHTFCGPRYGGARIERDGKERPKRTPSHAEMLQAERTGLSAKDVKQKITELWQRADNGTRRRRPMCR